MTSNIRIYRSLGSAFAFAGLAVLLIASTTTAQTPTAAAGLTLRAASANAAQPMDVRVQIIRWSTDAERDAIVASMSPAAPAAGRGARGADQTSPGTATARGRGADAAPFDPITSLTAAIGKAPTLGYIWTNENTGYAIKYAYRIAMPDGGERVILVTNRRLANLNATPVEATGPAYTLVEVRLNANGAGEGKASLNQKAVVDANARTLALENYAGAATILKIKK